MTRRESFKEGLKAGIPIGLGYFAVSFTFGIMASAAGLSVFQSVLISASNLTSAGQFAGLGVIASMGSYLEVILTQVIINLRYVLMSLSLSQKFDRNEKWFHRYFVAHGVTDEIFGVSSTRPGKLSVFFNYGAMCLAIPGWSLGTGIGAALGNVLPEFIASALYIAIYGMFIAVIVPPSKKEKSVLLVVIGAMALSSVFAFAPVLKEISSGFVIIIVTIVVSAIAAAVAPRKEEE